MKDIKGILSLVKSQSNELKSDSFLKFQKSIEKLKIENQTLSPLVQFTKQFEILKKIIQEFLNFLKIKSNEVFFEIFFWLFFFFFDLFNNKKVK